MKQTFSDLLRLDGVRSGRVRECQGDNLVGLRPDPRMVGLEERSLLLVNQFWQEIKVPLEKRHWNGPFMTLEDWYNGVPVTADARGYAEPGASHWRTLTHGWFLQIQISTLQRWNVIWSSNSTTCWRPWSCHRLVLNTVLTILWCTKIGAESSHEFWK